MKKHFKVAWAFLVCSFMHRRHYEIIDCELIPNDPSDYQIMFVNYQCNKCGALWFESHCDLP